MNPNNLFQLEIAAMLAGKRSLAMRFGLTLLLALPFIIAGMGLRIRIAGLLMILIVTGFFGAAVAATRRRTDGRFDHLRLLPIPAWGILGDFLLAGALVDFLRMGCVFALFMLIHGAGFSLDLLVITAGLFLTVVLLLNLLGMLIGLTMKSNQDVHLLGALVTGVIAFMSGILPAPTGVRGFIQGLIHWNPLSLLGFCLERGIQGLDFGSGGSMLASVLILAVLFGAYAARFFAGRVFSDNPIYNRRSKL